MRLRLLPIAPVILMLTACGGGGTGVKKPDQVDGFKSEKVTEADADYDWPMIDSEGYVGCGVAERGQSVFWHGPDPDEDRWWGLNGTANSLPGVVPVDERVEKKDVGGQEMFAASIGPLIDKGLTLCE